MLDYSTIGWLTIGSRRISQSELIIGRILVSRSLPFDRPLLTGSEEIRTGSRSWANQEEDLPSFPSLHCTMEPSLISSKPSQGVCREVSYLRSHSMQ